MVYIKVRVTPDSKVESFSKQAEDVFDVAVRGKAKQGQANIQVLALVKKHFRTAKRLYIVSGHHSPHKIISVDY